MDCLIRKPIRSIAAIMTPLTSERGAMKEFLLTDMLRTVLAEAAAEADKHDCIAGLYIFGSMVRGDHSPTSDLDIAIDYVDPSPSPTNEWTESYTRWQEIAEDWALSLGSRIGHKVALHRMFIRDPEDAAWPTIVRYRECPFATEGKARMVYTPPKRSSA
jgi:predicted nucleotidyltransferase